MMKTVRLLSISGQRRLSSEITARRMLNGHEGHYRFLITYFYPYFLGPLNTATSDGCAIVGLL